MNVPPGPGVSCDFSQLNLRLATKAWRANSRVFNKRHPIFRDKIVGREDRLELRLATMNAFAGILHASE
jgi:hypothetical protein